MRKLWSHYTLGIALGLFVFVMSYLLMLIPEVGYGIFLVIIVLIIFAQGTFYGLTAFHGRAWSTIGFFVNLILWATELVQLEQQLDGSSLHRFLYHNDDFYALQFVLGGILWATNKLVIDLFIDQIIDKHKPHVEPLEQ